MKRTIPGLMLGLLLIAGPASAQDDSPSLLSGGAATPTFLGNSGLLLAPSAYTVGDRGVSAHAYFSPNFNSYGLNVGPIRQLEVGFSVIDPDNGLFSGGSQVIFNAKYALLEESQFTPGLAVGATDLFDELGVDTSWFIALSKDLSKTIPLGALDWRLHAGYGGGIYDDDIFLGVDIRIGTPADLIPVSRPTFHLIGELVRDDVNVGLRGRWKGFAATLGLFDFDDFGGGVSYTTGLRLQ